MLRLHALLYLNEFCYEVNRDRFAIDEELTDSNITGEKLLMNTPKRAKEVANRRPDPFNPVRMHLANAIAIVISRPLPIFMTDHTVLTIQTGIPTPTICIDDRFRERELMHMIRQSLFIRVTHHTQSHTTTLTTKRPNNRRAIIGVGAVAPPFVPAPTGRVCGVSVAIPFLTSVLEHLICLGMLIGQRRNRLHRLRIRLKHPTQRHHRLTIQTQLTGKFRTRNTLRNTTQQQHHLRRGQLLLLEYRATIKGVCKVFGAKFMRRPVVVCPNMYQVIYSLATLSKRVWH